MKKKRVKAIRISESSDDFLPDLAIYQIMPRIAKEVFRHVKAMQYGCPQDAFKSLVTIKQKRKLG